MQSPNSAIRKEAFECGFALVYDCDAEVIRLLVEVHLLDYAVEQLKTNRGAETSIFAAKIIYYVLLAGVKTEDRHNEWFRNDSYVNEFARELQDIGGVDIVEDLSIHPNKHLREMCCNIIKSFYGVGNDDRFDEFEEEVINQSLGHVEYNFQKVREREATLFRF